MFGNHQFLDTLTLGNSVEFDLGNQESKFCLDSQYINLVFWLII
jgi:hypothetical protein